MNNADGGDETFSGVGRAAVQGLSYVKRAMDLTVDPNTTGGSSPYWSLYEEFLAMAQFQTNATGRPAGSGLLNDYKAIITYCHSNYAS